MGLGPGFLGFRVLRVLGFSGSRVFRDLGIEGLGAFGVCVGVQAWGFLRFRGFRV